MKITYIPWRDHRYHHAMYPYRNILFASALMSASLLLPAGDLWAGACIAGVPGIYTCSGGGGADVTQSLSGNPLSVATSSGFGINTAAGNAFRLSGTNGVIFTDRYSSRISGQDNGIYATNSNAGEMSIITTGTVVGGIGSGIYADNLAGLNTTHLIVEAADVSANVNGISARNFGSGVLSLTALGTVTGGSGGDGIYAENWGTDLTLQAADVSTSGFNGIQAVNNGTGVLSLIASGTVTGGSIGEGVLAYNYGTGLNIQVASVISHGQSTINAFNYGSGALAIRASETLMGGGIFAFNYGTGLSIRVADVITDYDAIYALNYGSGALSISASGTVAGGNGGTGIYARNFNGTDLDIHVASIKSNDSFGIVAENNGTGRLFLTSTGRVEGGVDTRNYGTNLSMDLGEVTGGIAGVNYGSGALTLTARGTVSNDQGPGIFVENRTNGTDLMLDVASVSGNDFGIDTLNSGSGIQSITAKGGVTGQMAGIYATNASSAGEMSITATGTVVGADRTDGIGIAAWNYGASGTQITTTGTVAGGMAAISAETHGSLIRIINTGTVRNLSNFSNDLAIQILSGPSLIDNRGLMVGTLLLGDQGNRFMNTATGIWNTAGGTNDFGALAANNIVHNSGAIIAANGLPGDPVQTTRFNNISLFHNSGVLTMANGRPGDTTIIAGTYESNGGSLAIDTVLGGSASGTDKLVTERVSLGGGGSTRLYVNNRGGFGALTTGNGIPVIQVVGGVGGSAVGAFMLGTQVKAGVYEYSLFHNGIGGPDGNWYLRSTMAGPEPVPNYRAEVPVYMTSMSLASRFGLAMLGSCDDRSGADGGSRIIGCGGEQPDQLMWGRVFGVTGDVGFGGAGMAGRVRAFEHHGPSYDYDLSGFQVGMDVYRGEGNNGSHNVAGLYMGAGQASSTVDRTGGGRAGTVDMDGYSLGAYWTHKNGGGWYLDVVGQGTRYSDIDAGSVDGQRLKSNGWGFVGSLEAGYPIALNEGWSVTPLVQLVYEHLSLDGGKDHYGTIAYRDGNEFYGRLGGRLSKLWMTKDGHSVTTFVQANVWHGFGAEATTVFNSFDGLNAVKLNTDLGGTRGEIGFGVSGQISRNTRLFGAADYNFAVDEGKGSSVGGRVGISFNW